MGRSIVAGYSSNKVANINKYYREKKGFISVSATILVENWYTVGQQAGTRMLWEWIYLESYPNVVWKSIRVPSDVSYYNPSWPSVPFIKCGDFIELHEKRITDVSVSRKRKDNMFFDDVLDDKLGGLKQTLGE